MICLCINADVFIAETLCGISKHYVYLSSIIVKLGKARVV
jgi:hypothetical protein